MIQHKISRTTGCVAAALLCAATHFGISAQQVAMSGDSYEVITVEPDKNTGLDKIFVCYRTQGTTITYIPSDSRSDVSWLKFSNLGGGYAQDAEGVERDGDKWLMRDPEGDMGYIIEEQGSGGIKRTCIWVTDYSKHPMHIEGVHPAAEQECGSTSVVLSGSGDAIQYFTINGQRRVLDQQIEMKYSNLEWDAEQKQWLQKEVKHNIEYFHTEVYLNEPVLCGTVFEVSADRFLRRWGLEQSVVSENFEPVAVEQRSEAVQQTPGGDDPDYKSNQIKSDEEMLGGSAPAVITFYGYPSDAVRHSEWQMSANSEFEPIDQRFAQQDLEYTFDTEGVVYLRYVASNSDGTCSSVGDTYTVSIGASEIKCPNAFSPGASEGINDEWKVSYRSIVEFECWIFDRWGQEVCHFSDPELGWDGKYRGKYVKPGAYYYVIKAKGADGKEYKLSGDINILRYKSKSAGSDTDTAPTE